MIRPFAIALLLGSATAWSQNTLPPHIVQDIPADKDPRIIARQTPPPADIVRDLTPEEQTARQAALAVVDITPQQSQHQLASTAFAKQTDAIDQNVTVFMAKQGIAPVDSAPVAQEVEESITITMPPVGPNTTTVENEGGFYFDYEQAMLVYLRNVHVRSESMNLDCKNQLKVFLAESPEKQAKSKEKNDKPLPKGTPAIARLSFNFDEVKFITADGDVVITGKTPKGDPYQAYGDKMTFDGKTGESILTGENLYIVYDKTSAIRVTGEGSFIRLYENGNVYGKGKQSVSQLNDLEKQRDKNQKNKKKKKK